MTIRSDQFVQDIHVLELMYGAFGDLRQGMLPKSRQWYALMAQGSIDQIRETQVEMHEYLKLPYPVPAVPLPADADDAPRIANADDFRLTLEKFCRLYRALGNLHRELHQFRPRLYAALAKQMLPDLHAVQVAIDEYLEWAAVEETLNEMERQFEAHPSPESAPLAPAMPQLSEEKA